MALSGHIIIDNGNSSWENDVTVMLNGEHIAFGSLLRSSTVPFFSLVSQWFCVLIEVFHNRLALFVT
jgi:hypothetical protein